MSFWKNLLNKIISILKVKFNLSMPISIRNKTTEIFVSGLTLILIVLIIMTYCLDQKKSNWLCGPVLLIIEILALVLQSILNITIWKISNSKTKHILLAFSLIIIGFITYGFISFNLKCT